MTETPAGFSPHFRTSPVTDAWEPLYSAVETEAVRIGFFVGAAHCNARGLLHGGVIAALADNAMGLSLGQTLKHRHMVEGLGGIVTTSLAVDYIAAAVVGDWVEIAPRVLKAGRGSGLVDALITANGALTARTHAAFHVRRDKT
ncbi:MAG: PaaI family thioesterase [Alphaproteobacteria bacterium]|jgi:uncharacterized protein (TIGR00369 family)|nr:PaaI family thioesterase [Alphaproteobacteria bacterium]